MSPPPPELVRFPSGGGTCVGDLYRPPKGNGPPPVVIMAHGIGAQRDFSLEPFARRFVTRDMAALVFDYRHFGDSTGEPRYLVSPARQIEDYLAAAEFVRAHPELDGGRMALWGTSFSGGHVLEVASRSPAGVRAVVSQIPFVSGIASTLVFPLRFQLPAVVQALLDHGTALLGRAPLTVPVTAERGLALLPGSDARAGYSALVPVDTDWPGRLPARVFLSVLTYRPLAAASRVNVPTLLVVAEQDEICPARAARKAARRIRAARLEELPIGHFGAYFGEWFERVVELEARFLEAHLVLPGDDDRLTGP
jgi:uncharacterized protein